MRILTIGNQYPPHDLGGGYELVWRSAVEHLRAAGHEVRVLTTDHRRPGADSGGDVDVHRELRWYWVDHAFPKRSLRDAHALERHNANVLRRHLDGFRPDVVSPWSMGGMSMGLLEQVRRAGLPQVCFVHDDWLGYGRRVDAWHARAPHLAERLTGLPVRVDFAGAARYVFVSNTTRERARASGLALPDTGVAHSGIDPAFVDPQPERPWAWRLVCVGRIDPRKGLDTAVEALAQLPAEATLEICGTGEGEAALRERVRALGLEERVRFAGQVAHADLPARYDAADVVVFPVVWEEPWGLVPLEGMARGRPVVATGRGGSAEYLRDGDNALLFPAGDAAALAAAVRRLAEDPALRARLREGGLPAARTHTETALNEAVERELAAAVARRRAPVAAPLRSPGVPRLSVVIPTYKRPDALPRTLAALERQTIPAADFEVLVVADAQEDDAERVAAQVAAEDRPYAARVLHRHAAGVSAARNDGWQAAQAPLVMFIGDDILADPTLLAEHLAWHERHPDERVGVLGHVRWADDIEVSAFMRWLEHGTQFDYPTIDGEEAGWGRLYTSNVSLKRALLERAGGFDEENFPFLYEDLDLGYRLSELGLRLLYNPAARAQHLHHSTVEEWRSRMANTARAEHRFVTLHPGLEPWFRNRMADVMRHPPARGRTGRHLLRWVPPGTPWLGPKVWGNATLYYRQQLAPAFLQAWDEVASSGGAPPGGPK